MFLPLLCILQYIDACQRNLLSYGNHYYYHFYFYVYYQYYYDYFDFCSFYQQKEGWIKDTLNTNTYLKKQTINQHNFKNQSINKNFSNNDNNYDNKMTKGKPHMRITGNIYSFYSSYCFLLLLFSQQVVSENGKKKLNLNIKLSKITYIAVRVQQQKQILTLMETKI